MFGAEEDRKQKVIFVGFDLIWGLELGVWVCPLSQLAFALLLRLLLLLHEIIEMKLID